MSGDITHTFMCLQSDIRNHSVRTSIFARIIAEHTEKFFCQYNKEQLPKIYMAIMDGGMYHDIGKIFLSKYLLNKNETLTEYELKIIHRHPMFSEQIIVGDTSFLGCDEQYLSIVVNMAKHHHENFDGNGYLSGLSGDAIPIEARICSVADAFEHLLSKRGHKKTTRWRDAVNYVESQSGKQFDSYIVDCLRTALPKIEDVDCMKK